LSETVPCSSATRISAHLYPQRGNRRTRPIHSGVKAVRFGKVWTLGGQGEKAHESCSRVAILGHIAGGTLVSTAAPDYPVDLRRKSVDFGRELASSTTAYQ
jgi:hypothetical protein